MKFIATIILLILSINTKSYKAHASSDFFIFGISNEFPLNNNTKALRDYYINIGTQQGIKAGSTLEVFRKIIIQNKEKNEYIKRKINFKIAKIKVIHATENISIGRLIKIFSKDTIPITEQKSIIIGDRVAIAEK